MGLFSSTFLGIAILRYVIHQQYDSRGNVRTFDAVGMVNAVPTVLMVDHVGPTFAYGCPCFPGCILFFPSQLLKTSDIRSVRNEPIYRFIPPSLLSYCPHACWPHIQIPSKR